MLERDVESAIVDYAEDRGVIAIKLNGVHNRGKPDRLFFYQNRTLVVEMKKPGEEPTVLQESWLNRFRAQKFPAIACDNVGKGKTAIDMLISDDLDML